MTENTRYPWGVGEARIIQADDTTPRAAILRTLWQELHLRYADLLWEQQGRLVMVRDGRLEQVTVAKLSPFVTHAVSLGKATNKGEIKMRAVDRGLIGDVVEGPQAFCRPLRTVVHAPYLGLDGKVVTRPGYDAAAAIWLEWQGPPVDLEAVTLALEHEVLARLLDYPFVDEADRAHALGLILTPLLRPAIEGPTPLHTLISTGPGTGKTYFCRSVGVVAEGTEPSMRGFDDWSSEAARQLTTYLLSCPTLLVLDNLPTGTRVGGSDLHRCLTADGPIGLRPIGAGEERMVDVMCTWIATANNPDFDDEMVRRTIPIRLHHLPGRKWMTPNLIAWILEHRTLVLACLLRLVQRWVEAGRPAPSRVRDGYLAWSQVVGGVVEHAGLGPWLHPSHEVVSTERGEWSELLGRWPRDSAGRYLDLRPKGVLQVMKDLDLHTLLDSIAGKSPESRLGRLLASTARGGRSHDGYRLEVVPVSGGKGYRPIAPSV